MKLAPTPASQIWQTAPNFLSEYELARDLWAMLSSRIAKIEDPRKPLWRAEFLVLRIVLSEAEKAWDQILPQIRSLRTQGYESALGITRDQLPEAFEKVDAATERLKESLQFVKKWN